MFMCFIMAVLLLGDVRGSCLMVSGQQLKDWVDNYIQIRVETVKAIWQKTGLAQDGVHHLFTLV